MPVSISGDGIVTGIDFPACKIARSTNQTITNNTVTRVLLDNTSVQYDYGGMADFTTDSQGRARIYIRRAGVYTITGHVTWGANSTGERLLEILNVPGDNTSTISLGVSRVAPGPSTNSTGQYVHSYWPLAVGDYIVMQVRQTSGGDLTSFTSIPVSGQFPITPFLSVSYVRPI